MICERRSDESECNGYIDEYGDYLIDNILNKYINPKELCTNHNVCNYTKTVFSVEDFAKDVFSSTKIIR